MKTNIEQVRLTVQQLHVSLEREEIDPSWVPRDPRALAMMRTKLDELEMWLDRYMNGPLTKIVHVVDADP